MSATANNDEKQLVVTEGAATHLPKNERPVIVFQGLSDDQFDKALALFAPPPRTKPTLWSDTGYTEKLIKVSAFCESVMFVRPNGGLFANKSTSNNFDHVMIQKFRNDDNEFSFSIEEWFADTRGELPASLKNWNPDTPPYDPMPQYATGIDWCAKLTQVDLQFAGFLDLFANAIDLDEKLAAEISRRRHGATTAFGDHQGTQMPEPLTQIASFEQFTPSGLLSGGSSGGMNFGGGGRF